MSELKSASNKRSGSRSRINMKVFTPFDLACSAAAAAVATGIVLKINKHSIQKEFDKLDSKLNDIGKTVDRYWYCEVIGK